MKNCDVAVIGGGPAGLAAALGARKAGAQSVVILERDTRLGGILNQCVHAGFGLHTFREELTGPEYARRYVDRCALDGGIEALCGTTVLSLGPNKTITAVSRAAGLITLTAGAVVLAMGCRERSRGALNIPGFRPAGIFSAGTAQRLMNVEGFLPGRRVVILGSGDIGLIMARRMTLAGAKVLAVAEVMPWSGGLKRNIVQCLDDFGIPLLLRHTVTEIRGKERLEGVTLAQVDKAGKPLPGTWRDYDCDTLLLSVGLIPENELSRGLGVALDSVTHGPAVDESLETSVPGVFAAGNVLHVHDLVDEVSSEAETAGENAAKSARGLLAPVGPAVSVCAGPGVRGVVPARVALARMGDSLTVRFRVDAIYKKRFVCVRLDGERLSHKARPILTPGEMEQVELPRAALSARPGLHSITIGVEEA